MGDDREIDLFDPDFQKRPQERFAEMLKRCPVGHSSVGDFFSVAGYHDIVKICRDPTNWSSKFGPGLGYAPPDEPTALVNVDPPEHDFEVEVVQRAFSSTYVRSLEPEIRAFAARLLDDIVPKKSCDIHAEYSVPIPLFVICKLLGLDFDGADREGLRDWVIKSAANVLIDPVEVDRIQKNVEGRDQMLAYFVPRIEGWAKRLAAGEARPDENLITRLLTAEHGGQRLAPGKVLGFCLFLLVAGSATTTILISNLIYRLLERPDQFAKLRANMRLLPNAVEESLRFDAPVHGLFRTNNVPLQLGPYSLAADRKVMLLWGAGNLDPEMWERPDEFDIERDLVKLKRNLAFGNGIHACLGAGLARLEAITAMDEFLRRIPNPRRDGPVTLSVPTVLGGLDSLPIAWT